MSQFKSRINIKIEKICDWDRLLDIKIKEEWKLDKSAEDIFREAYYRGGFIKAGDWSVDPESLEDMVECFAKTIGHENCVIMADVVEQNVLDLKKITIKIHNSDKLFKKLQYTLVG